MRSQSSAFAADDFRCLTIWLTRCMSQPTILRMFFCDTFAIPSWTMSRFLRISTASSGDLEDVLAINFNEQGWENATRLRLNEFPDVES
jgi:hypothetical protein